MKNLFSFAISALLTLGAVSCSSESDLKGPQGPAVGNGTMTFEIKGLAVPTTYASVPVTTAAESQIDGELDIYMFDASTGLLVKKYTTASGDCSAYASGSVTISNLIEYQGQTMNFYIVANPGSADITTTDGTTDEADFVESMTELLTVTSGKISEEIETPLLLTGKTATTVQLTAAATASINLKRAVARFDVVNPFENFIIDEIYVSDARQQGYVFPQHTGALPSDVYSMDPVTGPATYETIGTERIARSVFYTYPTTMTETSITIKAHFEADPSASEYFTVNSTADIVANSRYKIVVSEDTLNGGDEENPLRSVTLSLVVMEWDEDAELPLEYSKGSSAALSDFEASTEENWTDASMEYDFTDNLGGTLTFTATSAFGTAYNIVFNEGIRTNLAQDIAVSKSTISSTYGYTTTEEYTVTIPKYSELGGGLYNISLEVYPANNPTAERQTVTFWNNISMTAANFNPDLLAAIQNQYGTTDVLTKEQIESITEIWQEQITISDGYMADLEYLTGLKELYLQYVNVESFILPYLPEFEKLQIINIGSGDFMPSLYLASVDVSQVKNSIKCIDISTMVSDFSFATPISNFPELEYVYFDCYGISAPIQICNNPKLNYLAFYGGGGDYLSLSDVTFNGNPALTELCIGFFTGDMLDLREFRLLERLEFADSYIPNVDISACSVLKNWYFLLNNPFDITLKVPANFPVDDYMSYLDSYMGNGNETLILVK